MDDIENDREAAVRAITALRAREAAIVAAAFEAAAKVAGNPRQHDENWQASALQAAHTVKAIRALAPSDAAAAALEAVKRAERNKARREAAALVALNAWKHEGDDAYSQGMDAGARRQSKADFDTILATIEPEDGE